ncbi:MAG: alpha/beta hydrolase [Anaerolineae bacterium]|nr:alpha/beta hydrolase [Anaerolineae bacterium]
MYYKPTGQFVYQQVGIVNGWPVDDQQGTLSGMPTVTLAEQSLFYAVRPVQNASASVVLLHGAGGSHLDWPGELRLLPGATVYALDLPGHGKSAEPGFQSVDQYATVVIDFITTLDLHNVFLIGHSMGGAIAQTVALTHPTWLRGLVLIGTGARLLVSDLILNQTLEQFEQVTAFIAQYGWARNTEPAVVQRSRERLLTVPPAIVYGDFVACSRFDVRDRLAEIDVPALVISAEKDKMMPAKFGRTLADGIPNAIYVEVPGAGHYMQLEQPQFISEQVQTFLQKTIN